MSKKALGRGIEALFRDGQREETEDSPRIPAATAPGVQAIPVDRIDPNPDQPRRGFDEAGIAGLAGSIRRKGILQPIIVAPAGDRYVIVAGERRWRAARLAGIETMPAIVRGGAEQERLEMALIENLQREDLDPIEEAQAYRHLMELGRVSQEDVAQLVGKDRSTVANSLRLLKLAPDVQAAVSRRELTPGHARAVLSVVNPADQKALVARIAREGLSVRQTEQVAARLNEGGRATSKKERRVAKKRDVDLEAVEKELFDTYGTKVEVRGDRKRGRIEISYFSAEDLDRIVELLLRR